MLLIIILLLIIIINLINVYFRKEKIIENNTGYDTSNTVKDCIVDWDDDYGECSAPCGGGTQELNHEVLNELRNGFWHGEPINAIQCPPTETRPCNEQPCETDCVGDWSEWSPCQKDDGTPAKCGGGKRSRSYNITQPAISGYIDGVLTPGIPCPHNHGDTQEEDCNVKPCAIDCVGGWDNFGSCNKEKGEKTITYKVTTPAQDGYIYNTDEVMEYDEAKPCDYTHNQTMSIDCNVDCEYKWSNWINDIDKGTRTRNLEIIHEPRNDGEPCPKKQQTQKIAVNCEGDWGPDYCVGFSKKRNFIISRYPKNNGNECPSSPQNRGGCTSYCADPRYFLGVYIGCRRMGFK